jgi:hypothetical protein
MVVRLEISTVDYLWSCHESILKWCHWYHVATFITYRVLIPLESMKNSCVKSNCLDGWTQTHFLKYKTVSFKKEENSFFFTSRLNWKILKNCYRFGVLDPENLRPNLIKYRYFLETALSYWDSWCYESREMTW